MNKITTGQGRLALAFPGHVNIAQPGSLTDELAVWLGQTFVVYTAGANTFQSKDSLVQAGGCETGRYTKTVQVTKTPTDPLPETGYSHKLDATGQLVRRFDAHWNIYMAEPASQAWRDYHQKFIGTAITGHPGDTFLFTDSAGSGCYDQGIARASGEKGPIIPGGKTVYSKPQWFGQVKACLDQWQAAYPDKRFLVNGLTRDTVGVYTPTVGMVEATFGSIRGVLPSAASWLSTVNFLVSAQAQGWTPWVYIKLQSWDASLTDPWRNLCVPTMFLADMGSLLYGVGGKEGTAQAWEVAEYQHPWYSLDLGVPLEDMQTNGFVYYRHFTDGLVVVNPQTTVQNFSPAEGGTITLDPQTGGFYRAVTTTAWEAL